MRKHPLVANFALAYATTWLLVQPLVLQWFGLISGIPPSWHPFGALGPMLSAFAVTALADGRAGVRELAGRMQRWRVGRIWFLRAVFSPFALFVIAATILAIFGGSSSLVQIGPEQLSRLGWIVGIFYGIGEEPGWRGFALPRLQRGRSALSATFFLAVLWFSWHTPFFFYRYELGIGGLVGFFFGLLAGAVWLTCCTTPRAAAC